MDRWTGRIAVVTGASSGIGETLSIELARNGMKVAALGRRLDKLQMLEATSKGLKGVIVAFKCDVTDTEEIAKTFKSILENLGPISVLINNAGIFQTITLTDVNQPSAKPIYDTNLVGLVVCTQHAVSIMRQHNINDGHIIHINSISGHNILPSSGIGHYSATKHAITSLTEYLKNELSALSLDIRVTSISPGLVQTPISDTVMNYFKHSMPVLSTKDVADCVIFALSVGPNVNVTELTVQPVRETIASFSKAK